MKEIKLKDVCIGDVPNRVKSLESWRYKKAEADSKRKAKKEALNTLIFFALLAAKKSV